MLSTLGRAESTLDPVYYPLTDENWVPYWIISDHEVTGILSEFMQELNQRLPYDLLPKTHLPPKRSQLSFIKGEVQLECCVSVKWRKKKEDAQVSLWSDTVLETEDILIFPKKMRFSYLQPSDLKDKEVATILGYSYAGEKYFTRSDSPNHISLVKKVALKRADVGIIDHNELNYLIKHNPEIRESMREIEKGPVISQPKLKIRIHKSRPEILNPINKALSEMHNDGVIKEIIKRHTSNIY